MGLGFSYAMANMLLDPLVGARTLREMPGGQGIRCYQFEPYLEWSRGSY